MPTLLCIRSIYLFSLRFFGCFFQGSSSLCYFLGSEFVARSLTSLCWRDLRGLVIGIFRFFTVLSWNISPQLQFILNRQMWLPTIIFSSWFHLWLLPCIHLHWLIFQCHILITIDTHRLAYLWCSSTRYNLCIGFLWLSQKSVVFISWLWLQEVIWVNIYFRLYDLVYHR